MLWFWRHWALHRRIVESHQPWAPGEEAACWVCGKTWTASYDGTAPYLRVARRRNNKAPRP